MKETSSFNRGQNDGTDATGNCSISFLGRSVRSKWSDRPPGLFLCVLQFFEEVNRVREVSNINVKHNVSYCNAIESTSPNHNCSISSVGLPCPHQATSRPDWHCIFEDAKFLRKKSTKQVLHTQSSRLLNYQSACWGI